MKRILFLIALLTVVNLYARVDFSFNDYQVNINGTPEYKLITVKIGRNQYIRIESEMKGYSTLPGEAEIPSVTKLIALPHTGNYVVSSITYDYEIKKLDKPLIQMGWEENVKKNNEFFSKDEWFPSETIKIARPSIMRNYRFTGVTVFPFKYNPQKNELKILKNIKVELKLERSINDNPLTRNTDNLYSEQFYQIAKSNILGINESRGTGERNYLFIIDTNFHFNYLSILKSEKQKLGYRVYLASLEEIGTDKENIKNYIQNAYDNWEYPPENVLLFGDTSGSFFMPTYTVEGTYMPMDVTDLPYTLVSGNDYFPDIMIGRISVRSQNQLMTVLNKIIHYETSPPMDSDWFSTAIMCCDMGETYNDYENLPSAKETKEVARQKLESYGYTTVHTFYAPEDTNLQTLKSYINAGCSLINYRGFGGPIYWTAILLNEGYMLKNDDIPYFTNGYKLPFVTSIVCAGGDFGCNNTSVCFGEMWVGVGTPTNPKGAIGFIGPSEHDTKTWFNNANDQGIYQGFTYENLQTGAQMLLRGKMELYRNFPFGHEMGDSHVSDQFYFYVYNLLGDPGLTVWSHMPKQIVSFERLTDQEGNIRFKVSDQYSNNKDFIVSITKDDSLYFVGKTDVNGIVVFPNILSSGEYIATASKKSYLPSSMNFEIINQDLAISEYEISPLVLHNNMDFTLDVSIKNISENTLQNLIFSSVSTDYITINSQSQNLENLAPNENYVFHLEGTISNVWNQIIDTALSITVSYDQGEKEFSIPLSLHTPYLELNLADNFSIPDNVTNYDFNIPVKNISDYETGAINAVLTSFGNDINIIQNSVQTDNLYPNQSYNFIFPIDVASVISGYTGDFKLELYSANQKMQEFDFYVPIGEVDSEDPTISYGYAALESNDNNSFINPTYNWVEICPEEGLPGTLISRQNQTIDGYYSYISLPFPVNYYGRDYYEITFSSNGWISMGEAAGNYFRNRVIPSGAGPSAMIAPYWDDLDVNANAYYYYDTANQRFIVEWYQTRHEDTNENYSFEVILYPSQNNKFSDILFQYKSIGDTDADGNYSTVGIETSDQEKGICMEFAHTPAPTAHQFEDNYAILFTDVNNLALPLISASYDDFDISMVVEDEMQFTVSLENTTDYPIKTRAFVSYENERDWIEFESDTLTVIDNNELGFTINPHNLSPLSDYKAYLEILTEYQQLIVVPIHLQTLADANTNDIASSSTNLGKIYPNPFVLGDSKKSKMKISYNVSKKSVINISVYNLKGEKVKTLLNKVIPAGKYQTDWDMKDANGQSVASGIYFYKLTSDRKDVSIKKCVIVK